MKLLNTIVFFLLFLVVSCHKNDNWEIEFCSDIDDKNCINENSHFKKNIKVYVTLESKEIIQEKVIIGNIYRMYEGAYDDYLGTKNFKIENGVKKIKHSIPFDQLGGTGPHLIEFTKENGELIISKELFIE